jgi:hypothetical protein
MVDNRDRLACKLCYFTEKCEVKSRWRCTACDVFLCAGAGGRQCFDVYHSPTEVIVPHANPV